MDLAVAANITTLINAALQVEKQIRERWHVANKEPAAQFQYVGRIRENPVYALQRNLTAFLTSKNAPQTNVESIMNLYQ